MPEALFAPKVVAKLLGGISARAVRDLIDDGKLRAKYQPLRGKQPGEKGARPRKYVPQSAIDEYIASLPAPGEMSPKRETARMKRLPASIRRELEEAPKVYR